MRRGMRVMPTLGTPELIIIFAIVVLLFGAGKLSGVGGALGKSIREFRKEKDGLDEDSSSTKKVKTDSDDEKRVLKSSEVESSEKVER